MNLRHRRSQSAYFTCGKQSNLPDAISLKWWTKEATSCLRDCGRKIASFTGQSFRDDQRARGSNLSTLELAVGDTIVSTVAGAIAPLIVDYSKRKVGQRNLLTKQNRKASAASAGPTASPDLLFAA